MFGRTLGDVPMFSELSVTHSEQTRSLAPLGILTVVCPPFVFDTSHVKRRQEKKMTRQPCSKDGSFLLQDSLGDSQMYEVFNRVWENLIGRSAGPLNFRLLIQPMAATLIAIRAGLEDAREGRPAFLWAALSNHGYRPELL